MKNKETLDFLKGTAMDGIINNNDINPVEKVEAKVQAAPSVIPPVKKSSAKKAEVKAENKIFTNVRIKIKMLKQARLILGEGKKTQEIIDHVFLSLLKRTKKCLPKT